MFLPKHLSGTCMSKNTNHFSALLPSCSPYKYLRGWHSQHHLIIHYINNCIPPLLFKPKENKTKITGKPYPYTMCNQGLLSWGKEDCNSINQWNKHWHLSGHLRESIIKAVHIFWKTKSFSYNKNLLRVFSPLHDFPPPHLLYFPFYRDWY